MGFSYVSVWGEGEMPLLMHAFTAEAGANLPDSGGAGAGKRGTKSTNSAGERLSPREIAETFAYREGPNGPLVLPRDAFQRMVRDAGASHKEKGSRKSLKYRVPAAVLVLGGDERGGPVPLFDERRKDASHRFRSSLSERGQSLHERADHDPSSTSRQVDFKLLVRINTDLMAESVVRTLFTEGGQQIGVGSWRPDKGGIFGLFGVVGWDVRDGRSEIHRSAAE